MLNKPTRKLIFIGPLIVIPFLVNFFGASSDAVGGLFLVDYFKLPMFLNYAFGITLLCLGGYGFIKSQELGLNVPLSYRAWSIFVVLTNFVAGFIFLGQEVKNPYALLLALLVAFFSLLRSSSEQKVEDLNSLNYQKFWNLAYICAFIFLTGILTEYLAPSTKNVTWILWVIGMTLAEILGTPISYELQKAFETRAFKGEWTKIVSYSLGFLPVIIFYVFVVASNDGYLFISNVMGNTMTVAGSLVLVPYLYKNTHYSKGSIVSVVLAIISVILLRFAQFGL